MASERGIKIAIEHRVNSADIVDFKNWTIGVTDDPETQFFENNQPKEWVCWKSDSEISARNVEKYFIDKGMKSSKGGSGTARNVYIF